MTIRKGQQWGVQSALPVDAPIANSDADLARLLQQGITDAVPAIVGLSGGEIWQLLGGVALRNRLHRDDAWTFPIDLAYVRLDGADEIPFVNAAYAHRLWSSGCAIMNGQVANSMRLGHRSHVNDGALDLTQWSLRIAEFRKVRERAITGSHMPHPRVTERRTKEAALEFPRRVRVQVDGIDCGKARLLEVRIVPDAGFVVA